MRSTTRELARKLARLSRREWADLVAAQIALLAAQVLVWTRPTGRLVTSRPAADTAPGELPVPGNGTALEPRAEELALAVGRAAEHGIFRPLCLVRAVALQRLLEAHGIHGSRVRVGVRLDRGRFLAHAWVEHRQHVLGDRAELVRTFAELADVRVGDAP